MSFILSISIFIFLDTFFDTFGLSLFLGGGAMVSIAVGGVIVRKRKKTILSIVVLAASLLLSTVAVRQKNRTYRTHANITNTQFVGTGTIIQRRGNGAYIFKQGEAAYLYYSDKDYSVGTEIFTSASYQAGTGAADLRQPIDRETVLTKLQKFTAEERWFDKAKWLLMQGWQGSVYEKSASVLSTRPKNMRQKVRQNMASLLEDLYTTPTYALTMGMLIGDRSSLTRKAYASFVDSGLVHIIAVSGGNIVLITSFLSAMFFFLPYYIRLSCIGVLIVGYAFLCGMDSSVVRAMLMALLSTAALFSGRMLSVWRSIRYVYVAMLLRNPYYLLYDLGFVFSFSALIGLVYFGKRWSYALQKKLTFKGCMRRFRNTYLLPSMAASLGIGLPLLFFTGRVTLVSILSNIVVVPLIPFVMIYGFFAAIVYSVTSWQRMSLPQEYMVWWIYAVSKRSNEHAVTVVSTSWYIKVVIVWVVAFVSAYIIYRYMRTQK